MLYWALSWLTENGFSVDTQDRCQRNVNTGQLIPCSVRWIPEVLIMEEEPLEDGEILLIIDESQRYSRYAECFSAAQAARLPEHKSWDHQMPLQHQTQRYPQGPSTRPPGKKTKPSDSTCSRISQQERFDVLVPLLLHQSYSYENRMLTVDSALTTRL